MIPPPNKLKTLYLLLNDQRLGTLTVSDLDMPWVLCNFKPTEAFTTVKPLFDEVQRLIEEDDVAWSDTDEQILALGLVLQDVDSGGTTTEFLLNIKDDEASLRY